MSAEKKENNSAPKISRRYILGSLGAMTGYSVLPRMAEGNTLKQKSTNRGESRAKYFESLPDAIACRSIQTGDMVITSGYYEAGDGGDMRYRIIQKPAHQTGIEEFFVLFENGLTGIPDGLPCVNYKMFGARCDGISDDGIQMKMAHEYANLYNLPVVVLSGEYWIHQTRNIKLKTPVSWGQSIFHINEVFNTREPVFSVPASEIPKDLLSDNSLKNAVIGAMKPGVQQISELKPYSNHLLWIRDNNDRIGFRYGPEYNNQSRGREELIYVEEDGRILGDVAWSFKNATDLVAYPAETSYLIIEGGTFYLSGENKSRERAGYFQCGFQILRSRTIIRNQWMGIEKGKTDNAINPRSGFYSFSNVYDCMLENVRLIPFEYDRPGTGNDGYSGTYGIGGNRMMNITFRNITAEGTRLHWGVFGTNMNKNFRVENCRLNRIDVHFHCWNLTVKDSHIGGKGITITGGGELNIENTRCDSARFINFRNDFGAKWDGNITIRNCRLRPDVPSETSILYFVAADFNYGYPIGWAQSIHIENFILDYSTIPDDRHDSWLIRSSSFSKSGEGKRSFFPAQILLRNIVVQGREKGVRLMRIADPKGFLLTGKGLSDGTFFKANSLWRFDRIMLEETGMLETPAYHILFEKVESGNEPDSNSLYPEIHISDCPHLSMRLDNAPVRLLAENTVVNRINSTEPGLLQGEFIFNNCRLIPIELNDHSNPYDLNAALGTSFMNCVFHLPRLKGIPVPSAFDRAGLITINKSVRFNHICSRLGNDLTEYLKQERIKVLPAFL